ncbi:MAG TPA: bifunctional phosphopantothenoylcysteine decarboxylase/phosphopantothenate--cysteine ligase CoaBC [Pyrinomonadaceae bacterium]|nr:bifunctional phosphopantothenoylcysteine decarboxylase/phosphopantothenate--cysteine ligase CoaBC [Pyrinomonadaceae bacterium]
MTHYRIGLGVSGGIAAYKAIEVMRLLQKKGCSVSVAMTEHSAQFISPLTFRALTKEPVIVNDYDPQNPDPIAHINFAQNIDLLLVAPATANIIAKFANGIADDFLSTVYLACPAPVLVAPAMNTVMLNHPATLRNLERLRADGVGIIHPEYGMLACETIGDGKLAAVEEIVETALTFITEKQGSTKKNESAPQTIDGLPGARDLAGEKVLLTIGATVEAIDPVRYISNHSSGKMGLALAESAQRRGAQVRAIVGKVSSSAQFGFETIKVESAEEMYRAVEKNFDWSTIFIAAAAVADYRPKSAADSKIKKNGKGNLLLELEETVDILKSVSSKKSTGQLIIGFAAETNDVLENARKKMSAKSLDMIVANDVSRSDIGFGSEENEITIISPTNEIHFGKMKKSLLAEKILDEIVKLRKV